MTALDTLRRILDDGLVGAVYEAEQIARLDDRLSALADRINELGLGEFFGAVQRELTRTRVLHIARLYDRPNPRFPSFSLSALLDFLELHAGEIPILEKPPLLDELRKLGGLDSSEVDLEDAVATRALVSTFRKHLPSGGTDQEHPLDAALRATRTMRSKEVAHPELVVRASLPRPTYEELDRLLHLAKELVATITFAYFRVIDVDSDGRFLADAHARRAANCLERLVGMLAQERSGDVAV